MRVSESADHRISESVGRRVSGPELWVGVFQTRQLGQELVVLEVGDLRLGECIVEPVVVMDARRAEVDCVGAALFEGSELARAMPAKAARF